MAFLLFLWAVKWLTPVKGLITTGASVHHGSLVPRLSVQFFFARAKKSRTESLGTRLHHGGLGKPDNNHIMQAILLGLGDFFIAISEQVSLGNHCDGIICKFSSVKLEERSAAVCSFTLYENLQATSSLCWVSHANVHH